jgi:amino acid permease
VFPQSTAATEVLPEYWNPTKCCIINSHTMDDTIKSAPPMSEKPFKAGDSRSTHSGSDVEKHDVKVGETVQLQRRLQSRHIQMIAIGGTIGTGTVHLECSLRHPHI